MTKVIFILLLILATSQLLIAESKNSYQLPFKDYSITYDYLTYKNLNNYFCIYGYQKASVIAISKYLNGEFEITSISPIKF